MHRELSSATETRTDASKQSAQNRRKIDANTAKKASIFDASSQSVSEVASEPKTVALRGGPGRPRRLPRGPRELPEPPWSVPGTPPEHPRRSPGAPNACNRAPVTSKRRPGTSKSSLRRPPGPHFGASGSDFPSFLVFFWDIPERKFPKQPPNASFQGAAVNRRRRCQYST